jgi:predicted transcriptional regulator
MSIRPEYAEKILRGDKTVEFRKKPLRRDVSHVLMYATAPSQMLVGLFEVRCVEEATPEELWRRYAGQGGVGEEAYRSYFASSPRGCAIQVGRVFPLRQPTPLEDIGPGLPVPQSYYYVRAEVLDVLFTHVTDRTFDPGAQGKSRWGCMGNRETQASDRTGSESPQRNGHNLDGSAAGLPPGST